MNCPECRAEREHIIRNADAFYVPEEMRPAGLFAWVLRCWECGRNESGYTHLTFRPVTMDDAEMIYRWRIDPETRNQSFDQRPILYESHRLWMSENLRLDWWMGTVGPTPVGQVRVLLGEVNITVAPEWRGLGIGSALLAFAPIPTGTVARVKGDNLASRRAFEKAGWRAKEVVYVKN